MSSTLEHRAPTDTIPEIPRAEPVTAPPAPAGHAEPDAAGDPDARGFSNAIMFGAIAGLVAWTALITVLVKWQMPDIEWLAAAGIGVWTGIFGGTFLGGTITVGRWSAKNH